MIKGDEKIGNEIGRLGEDIACKFLEQKKYKVIQRNFKKKCGEIDIIALKNEHLHFIEVKTVSCEMTSGVTRETVDRYRAEDNIHPWKIKRLKRAIQSYFLNKRRVSPETNWLFDVIVVRINKRLKKATISLREDQIL